MNQNEFIIDLLARLNEQKSKKQIDADIKQLENVIKKIELICTFTEGNTKKELNAYITQLNKQLDHIKLQAKLDNKKLQREINESLKNISFSDIDLNIDEGKMKMKVQKAVAEAKAVIDKTPLFFNIETRKEKLNNQLTSYLNKNSKIKESSLLLEEADKLRKIFSGIEDKNTAKDAAEQFQLFKSEVVATGFAGQSTTDKIKNMVGHITKIGTAFGVASTAINQFSQSQRNLREIDTILTEISKTSEMTKNQLIELGDASFDTANKYGQLAKNYLLGVQEMARSGYEEKATELGELSLIAQSAGDMTAEMANDYILATDAAYKYSGSIEKLTSALDGVNYISNKNSSSLTDIADGIRVSASYAANAGVEIDQLTAAEATMIATTKRSGSEMGRAFRSILLNLQQVSGEFDGEIIDEESLKKVENRCHSLGVELETLKDGVATLRNPMEVLKELSQVYNSLPDSSADKQGLISDIGGKYHANALSALLSRWDLYEKMLQEYSQGTGSALVEANKTADSWEGRLSQLQNTWDSFVNSITNKEAVKGGISFLDGTIQSFEKLTDIMGTIPTMLATINGSVSALNKDYGITQLFNQDTHKMDIQGSFMGINFTEIKAQKKHFEEAAAAIDKWNAKLISGQTDLNKFGESIVKNSVQFKSYLETCSKDAPASLAGYKKYLNEAGISTDTFRLKTVLLTSAMSLGIGLAVQTAVSSITKMLHAQEEMHQKAQELTSEFKNTQSSIDDYKTKISELHAVMNDSSSSIADTTKARQDLMAIQDELIEKFGREKETIDIITKAIQDQSGALDELSYRQYLQWKNDFNDKNFGKSALDFLSSGNIGNALYKLTELDFSGAWDMLTHPTETNMDSMINSMEHAYYELEKTGNETLDGLIKKSYGLKDSFDGSKFIISGNLGEIQEDLISVQELAGDFDVSDRFEADLTRVSNSINKTLTAYEDAYDTYLLYEKILDKAKDNPYDEQFDSVNKAKEAYDTAFASGDENRIQEEANRFASVLSGAVNVALENNDTDVAGYFRNMYPELQAIVAGWEFSADFKLNTDDIKGKVSGAADQFTSSEDIMSFNPSIASQEQVDAYAALNAAAEQYGMTLEQMIVLLEKENVLQSENRKQLEEKFGKDNVMTLSNEDLQIAYKVTDGTIQSWDELIAKIEECKATLKEDDTEATISSTIDQLNSQFEPVFDSLQSAYQKIFEMKDGKKVFSLNNVDMDMLAGIKSSIEEINKAGASVSTESFEALVSVLTNSSSTAGEVQNAFNQMATSVCASLGRVTEENAGLIQSILEQMGVTNAQEIVSAKLTETQQEQWAAEMNLASVDIKSVKKANDLLKEATSANITKDKLVALIAQEKIFKNNDLSLADKINGLQTLASTYGQVALASKIASSQKQYDQNSSNRSDGANNAILSSQYEEFKKEIESALNNPIDVDFSYGKSYSGGGSGSSQSSKSVPSKKEINWIDRKLEILAKRLEIIKTKASEIASTFQNQNKWLNEAIKNTKRQIEVYEKAKKSYLKKAENVDLSSSLKSKVRNGNISISSYNKSDAEKIEEYKKWYDAAKKADDMIVQLTLDIGELRKQKIDNIIDDYDRKKSYQEALISYRQAKMGDTGSEGDYNYLIQHTNHIKANLQKEYDKVKKQFDTMIKNKEIAKYSDDWYEYKEILVGIKTEIEEATESVVEFKKSIMSLRFDSFTKALETLENLSDEISNVQSLLSDELFDGTALTKDGMANLTLNFQGMAQAQEKIKAYQGAIDSLSKNLKNGNISQEEYNEKLTEYTKAQKDASLELKSYRDAVINLAVDAINSETEAMQKLVKSKKETLQAEKDLHDYRNSIADKEKNIAVLQAKIAELSKSTDRKDIALRLELEADLAEAQKDLSEEQYDHDMQLKQDALDEELENYEEAQDKKIKDLKTNLESQEKVLDNYLKLVQKDYSSTMDYISKNAATFSYNLTDLLSNPWDEGMSKAKSYKEFIDTILSDASISSSKIDTTQTDSSNSSSSMKNIGSTAKIGLDVATGNLKSTEHLLEGEGQKIPDSQKVSSLSGTIKSGDSGNKVTVLQKALKALGFNPGTTDGKFGSNTASAVKSFQKNVTKVTGDKLSADGVVGSSTKKKFKLNGYKNGVRNLKEDELANVNEDGQEIIFRPNQGLIFPLQMGDSVYTNKELNELVNLSRMNARYPQPFSSGLPNTPEVSTQNTIKIEHLDASVNVTGVTKDEINKRIEQGQKETIQRIARATTGSLKSRV